MAGRSTTIHHLRREYRDHLSHRFITRALASIANSFVAPPSLPKYNSDSSCTSRDSPAFPSFSHISATTASPRRKRWGIWSSAVVPASHHVPVTVPAVDLPLRSLVSVTHYCHHYSPLHPWSPLGPLERTPAVSMSRLFPSFTCTRPYRKPRPPLSSNTPHASYCVH